MRIIFHGQEIKEVTGDERWWQDDRTARAILSKAADFVGGVKGDFDGESVRADGTRLNLDDQVAEGTKVLRVNLK